MRSDNERYRLLFSRSHTSTLTSVRTKTHTTRGKKTTSFQKRKNARHTREKNIGKKGSKIAHLPSQELPNFPSNDEMSIQLFASSDCCASSTLLVVASMQMVHLVPYKWHYCPVSIRQANLNCAMDLWPHVSAYCSIYRVPLNCVYCVIPCAPNYQNCSTINSYKQLNLFDENSLVKCNANNCSASEAPIEEKQKKKKKKKRKCEIVVFFC